ncbi:UBP42 hydrolase, partial [Ramphastos sulfuratus]|nr:UBP42 hydrolase [Ramphastos sulfuratus]
EGMAVPAGVLSPQEVCLEWQYRQGAGAGLYNLGQTCFLNSVLQCLTYTPLLANYLLSGAHSRWCQQQGFCMMCTMEEHIRKVLLSSVSAVHPRPFVNILKRIGKQFQCNRQEDAHEFLCHMLLAMQRACLTGSSNWHEECKVTPSVTAPWLSFCLCLPVTCLNCGTVSDCYEAFLDVPLDIRGASSVSAALQDLVQLEQLDGANCIRCRRCDTVAAASKRFTIQDVPQVLTLCLKRFDVTGRKICKHVEFPLHLDLRPYMCQTWAEPCLYSLYAVLVHRGGSCASGHYFCYIKASTGQWYQMDDSSVKPCSVGTVLQQSAYLLFYVR